MKPIIKPFIIESKEMLEKICSFWSPSRFANISLGYLSSSVLMTWHTKYTRSLSEPIEFDRL